MENRFAPVACTINIWRSSVVIKWSFKLIDTTRGVIYDRHMFIVQASGHWFNSATVLAVNMCTKLKCAFYAYGISMDYTIFYCQKKLRQHELRNSG